MNNVIKNTIKYGLEIMAILVLGTLTLTPNAAEARDRAGYYKGYSEDYVNTSFNPVSVSSVAYNPNPNTTTGYVLGANTSKSTTKTVAKAPATDYKEIKKDFSNSTANALFGADSFFPSSLIGWLLFAIFVLIIIALVRKFTGLENKYHATPLKHS